MKRSLGRGLVRRRKLVGRGRHLAVTIEQHKRVIASIGDAASSTLPLMYDPVTTISSTSAQSDSAAFEIEATSAQVTAKTIVSRLRIFPYTRF